MCVSPRVLDGCDCCCCCSIPPSAQLCDAFEAADTVKLGHIVKKPPSAKASVASRLSSIFAPATKPAMGRMRQVRQSIVAIVDTNKQSVKYPKSAKCLRATLKCLAATAAAIASAYARVSKVFTASNFSACVGKIPLPAKCKSRVAAIAASYVSQTGFDRLMNALNASAEWGCATDRCTALSVRTRAGGAAPLTRAVIALSACPQRTRARQRRAAAGHAVRAAQDKGPRRATR
jgi:hypothetical protein